MPTQDEHTPGPWTIDAAESVSIRDSEDGRICTINWLRGHFGEFGRRGDLEGEANAHLIAAAPELLAALRSLVTEIRAYQSPECDDSGAPGAAELRVADAAIAKATGRNRDADAG